MSNYKTVFFTLGVLLIVLGFSMLVPITIQLIYSEFNSTFIISSIITITFGALFFLATIAVLTSVVAAFYYIRMVKSIFFDEPTEDLDILTNNQSKLLMILFSFFNLTVILYPQFFLNLSASIALSLFALK